jgi:hypothetical protein
MKAAEMDEFGHFSRFHKFALWAFSCLASHTPD